VLPSKSEFNIVGHYKNNVLFLLQTIWKYVNNHKTIIHTRSTIEMLQDGLS
jgi:hypothetical protein